MAQFFVFVFLLFKQISLIYSQAFKLRVKLNFSSFFAPRFQEAFSLCDGGVIEVN